MSTMLTQIALQLNPLPLNPALHVQVNEPGVLVQSALASQPAMPPMHSSTSVQVWPSPVKPDGQAQVTVLSPATEQVALGSHTPQGPRSLPAMSTPPLWPKASVAVVVLPFCTVAVPMVCATISPFESTALAVIIMVPSPLPTSSTVVVGKVIALPFLPVKLALAL